MAQVDNVPPETGSWKWAGLAFLLVVLTGFALYLVVTHENLPSKPPQPPGYQVTMLQSILFSR